MGRIIFVNRFFWPETPATGQLLTDLASALALAGAEVLVITSGESGLHSAEEIHRGVKIVRALTSRSASASSFAKAVAFARFLVFATWQLGHRTRHGDIIVTLTDPPLLGIFGAGIAAFRRARLVHWIQDIYPEIAVAVSGHRWLHAVSPLRNRAWRAADTCVTLGREMADVVQAAGVPSARIRIIPNWSPAGLMPIDSNDAEVVALRNRWNLMGKFVVAYSGNLGRVHDLSSVIAAASLLRDEPRIMFLFVGGGAQRSSLEDRVAALRLENVRFEASQSRKSLAAALGVGDVHLVTLRPGCERFVFPSKLYGVAAIARPVFFVGPPRCEVARQVVEAEMGLAVDSRRPEELAEAIRELAADAAAYARYQAGAARFGGVHVVDRAVEQWRALLQPDRLPSALVPAKATSAP